MNPSLLLSPLGSILLDVQRAIDAKLYYPALLVSLTLPEICAALSLPKSVFVKEKHYTDFVDKYTTPAKLGTSGVDCYRLRGGVVHRANMVGHDKAGSDHVIFTLPGTPVSVHAMSFVVGEKKSGMFDLVMFCGAMRAAVEKWFEEKGSDPTVSQNMANLIRYCPVGFPPYLTGIPVVASGE